MIERIRLNPSFLKSATVLFAMGWLRLVGSLKLQVSFAEYILCYRAFSQKRPAILRSLLIVAMRFNQVSVESRAHAPNPISAAQSKSTVGLTLRYVD